MSGDNPTLRLIAADNSPEETDAPQADENPVAYDSGLLVELEEWGPKALAEFGRITVREAGDAARYNSACWYALAHDLVWEHRGDVVVLTDPKGESA